MRLSNLNETEKIEYRIKNMLEFYKYITADIISFMIFISLITLSLFTFQILIISSLKVLIEQYFLQKVIYLKSLEIMAKDKRRSEDKM